MIKTQNHLKYLRKSNSNDMGSSQAMNQPLNHPTTFHQATREHFNKTINDQAQN